MSLGSIYDATGDCDISINNIHDKPLNSIYFVAEDSHVYSDINVTASKTSCSTRKVLSVSSLCIIKKIN